jgi:hypothetical protein
MQGSIVLDGLEETLRAVVSSEVAQALADVAAPRKDGYLDVNGAAAYLSTTPAAVRSAVKRKQLESFRSATGRVLFTREMCDRFARGGETR